MSRVLPVWIAVFCALFVLVGMAHAADETEGLYAPPPPADAAYVRVIDPNKTITGAGIKLGGQNLTASDSGIGSYHVITQGQYDLAGQAVLQVMAGRSYSYVLGAAGQKNGLLLEDNADVSGAKAKLVLYNLTDVPALTLSTADGALKVIESVAPSATGQRQVKAMQVALAVTDGSATLGTTPAVQLERGQIYSIIAFKNSKGDVVVHLEQNQVARK